jgi:hypothetical protein
MALARWKDLCVDVADPGAVAAFWAPLLGLQSRPHTRPGVTRLAGEPPTRTVWLNEVPEPKTVKNRVHLDLVPADRTRDEEVERLLGIGAALVADQRRSDGTGWVVLADREGNELCIERSAAERAATG